LEPRTLEELCGDLGEYVAEVNGNIYCSLGMTRVINCLHHSGLYEVLGKDHNEFYFCTNPAFNPLAHELLKKYEV